MGKPVGHAYVCLMAGTAGRPCTRGGVMLRASDDVDHVLDESIGVHDPSWRRRGSFHGDVRPAGLPQLCRHVLAPEPFSDFCRRSPLTFFLWPSLMNDITVDHCML